MQIQIFRAGKHFDTSGQEVTFSEADLRRSVAVYDPALHEAPVCIGHPRDNAPAYGWVKALAGVGDSLAAALHQVDTNFSEMVRAGRFKKISASFYTPESKANPVPGAYYLRHVGFLGALPPAIKGLKPVEFAEAEDGVIEFSEVWANDLLASMFRGLREFLIDQFGQDTADRVVPSWSLDELQRSIGRQQVQENPMPTNFSETPAPAPEQQAPAEPPAPTVDFAEREAAIQSRERELAAREAALHRSEVLNFVETLVKDPSTQKGRLLPAQKGRAVELLCRLDDAQEVSFSEGDTEVKVSSLRSLFREFLLGLPPVVDYGERAPASSTVEPLTDPNEIARLATEYREAQRAKGQTVSFAEAIAQVTKEQQA